MFKKRVICMALCCAIIALCSFSSSVFSAENAVTYKEKEKSEFLVAENYDYSSPVPESPSVGNSFFDKSVFIGDSRCVDIVIYSDLNKTKALPYCEVGLNVNTAQTKDFVNIKGKSYTALEALKKNKSKFSKVYLMFGLNELGYPSIDGFINQYEKLISAVRKINSDCEIYISGVLPVTKQKDLSDKVFNLKNIRRFNKEIAEMCSRNKVFYIDAFDAFLDSEGYLPAGVASDGIHFSASVCGGWFNYLKSHTVSVKK